MIGPGTISAAVVTGVSVPFTGAIAVIAVTLALTCSILIAMKYGHDHLRYKHAKHIDRYFDIMGRLSALLIGTIAVDMIVNGVMGLMQSVKLH